MQKFEVIVSLKQGIVDPEGENTRKALVLLGFRDVAAVQSSRRFIIETENGMESEVEEMCRKLLANPAIHTYSIRRLGDSH